MKSILIILVLAGTVPSTAPSPASSQPWSDEVGGSLTEEQIAAIHRDPGGFGLHYQVGGLYRLASNLQNESSDTYLFTADLSGFNWSRTEAAWGLGVHFAVDGDGRRLGVKGLWKTPLKKGTWSYFQVAPGIYVSGTDERFDSVMPGFFLEAELGLAREFALVTLLEVLPYENLYFGYHFISPGDIEPLVDETGTVTTVHVGAKAGQLGAGILTALGLIAGVIVAASFASSGWN